METLSNPCVIAQEFAQLLYDRLSGYNTVFHQLAQIIAKIAKRFNAIDVCNAKFQASLAEGDSAQHALIGLTHLVPCLTEAFSPEVKIKSQVEIPHWYQKNIRVVLPNPQLEYSWVCLYVLPTGQKLRLKFNDDSILELGGCE